MEEKILHAKKGMPVLIITVLLYLAAIVALIYGCTIVESKEALGAVFIIAGGIWTLIGWIFWLGLRVLKPQEALVITLFGKYK